MEIEGKVLVLKECLFVAANLELLMIIYLLIVYPAKSAVKSALTKHFALYVILRIYCKIINAYVNNDILNILECDFSCKNCS
jgi:hypothetical protein